tara:strand:+ start:1146 stop:1301 length:156 start_codon:yes stop_codon:yes gene_type:complete
MIEGNINTDTTKDPNTATNDNIENAVSDDENYEIVQPGEDPEMIPEKTNRK